MESGILPGLLDPRVVQTMHEATIRHDERIRDLDRRLCKIENIFYKVAAAALAGSIGGGAAVVALLKLLGAVKWTPWA